MCHPHSDSTNLTLCGSSGLTAVRGVGNPRRSQAVTLIYPAENEYEWVNRWITDYVDAAQKRPSCPNVQFYFSPGSPRSFWV